MGRLYRLNNGADIWYLAGWILAAALAYCVWLQVRRRVRYLVHGSGRTWKAFQEDSKRVIG